MDDVSSNNDVNKGRMSFEDRLYETALADFLYLSEQRLKFIRFYIVLVGLFFSIIGLIFYKSHEITFLSLIVSLVMEIVFACFTYVFLKIDNRHYELIDKTKLALKYYETKYLNLINQPSHDLCFFLQDNEKSHKISSKLKNFFYFGFGLAFVFFLITFALIIMHMTSNNHCIIFLN